MCAFSENRFRSVRNGPGNTRQPRGQCGRQRVSKAENSAATASIAGIAGPVQSPKTQGFIGFFAMARRLLILLP
jgi:hypothetical protein